MRPFINVLNKHHAFVEGEYIGRGSPLGNPYVIGKHGTRDEVCDQYQNYFDMSLQAGVPSITNELVRLADIAKVRPLNLICFCSPARCHGLTIKAAIEEILNA